MLASAQLIIKTTAAMNQKPLKITISGRRGAGKTTLAHILATHLSSAGHVVSVQDEGILATKINPQYARRSGSSFSQMQPTAIAISTEMESTERERPFEIQFADGHKMIVRERNFSRASALAAYQRMQDGGASHIELGVDGGRPLE